jgi:L-lactate dehydrogenase complex protein LldF
VYKNIGGHSYGTTYSGPIGSVISPYLEDFDDYKHLSFASSLCGACTEICPVMINLHKLLLYNRNETVKRKHTSAGDRFMMKNWKRMMKKRWIMDLGGSSAKNITLSLFFRKSWGKKRTLPKIKERSFRNIWIEKREI